MDYEELKRKYETDSEKKISRRPTKLIVVALLVVVVSVVVFIYFIPSYRANVMLMEINPLSPDEGTIDDIKNSECKNLEKYNEYWVVNDCKDDVSFKLFIVDDGYYLTYCTDWETPREAFYKLRSFISPNECVDASLTDKKIENTVERLGFQVRPEFEVYEVCGLTIIFRDRCILTVTSRV